MGRGYVEQERSNRGYLLGPRFFQMGSAYLQGSDLAAIARPHLEALRDAVGETAYLVIFSQGEIVQLCKADGKQAVSAAIRSMVREPAYCTATGKVLLSALGAQEFDKYVQRVELQAFTPQTLTSKAELRREIGRVRENGFALDNEEFVPNLCCVSVPVTQCDGAPVAAISIAMPKMRFQQDAGAALVRADAREGAADHAATRPDRSLAGAPCSIPHSCWRRCLSGLTAAMFLFIVASGLSLIFGVLRVLNFAHGSFYMLGAYVAWQLT